MMKARWSARRVVRQLWHIDCVVKEVLGLMDQRDVNYTKTRLRTPSTDQWGHLSSIRMHLAEGHLKSRNPLHVMLLTSSHRRLYLEWGHSQVNWATAEWNQVVFSNESRFNLSNDDNRVRVWRHRGEHQNPAFALQ
ncbi:transposable element Tcb1 transposase [Trichonephila clavipes]|nr:transposable element Tcb1 transposase [Trichonephila clavipes]